MSTISISTAHLNKCILIDGQLIKLSYKQGIYYLLSNLELLDGAGSGIDYPFIHSYMSDRSDSEQCYFSSGWSEERERLFITIEASFRGLLFVVPEPISPVNQPAFCTLSGVDGDVLYTGLHSYHSHHDTDSLHNSQTLNERDSYFVGVELENECNSATAQNWLKSLQSNWFYLESDGSLSNYGAELITIKLNKRTAIDVNTWKNLTKAMSEKGITSHNNNRCGLHVHISKTGLGKTEEEQDRTMLKLLHLYHNELGAGGFGEDYISKVCRRPYSSYCSNVVGGLNNAKQTAFNFIRLNKLESLSLDGIKNLSKDMSKTQPSRVEAINRMNTNTIEFRQGKGTLKPESIVTTIQFCCELVEFCRVTNEKNCTRDNFFKRIEKLSKNNPLRLTLIPSRDI